MDAFFAWVGPYVTALLDWLVQLVKDVFLSLVELLQQFAVWVLDGVLGAIASLIEAVPVPDFLSGGLQAYVSAIDPGVLWLVTQSGLPDAVALLGAGFVFRMVRKAVTLFQW